VIEELIKAVEAAVEATTILSKRRVVRLPETVGDRLLGYVKVGDKEISVTVKRVAALLTLHRSGGAVTLSRLARVAGTTSRGMLSVVLKMEEEGLVRVMFSPTRTAVVLTELGRRVAGELMRTIRRF